MDEGLDLKAVAIALGISAAAALCVLIIVNRFGVFRGVVYGKSNNERV